MALEKTNGRGRGAPTNEVSERDRRYGLEITDRTVDNAVWLQDMIEQALDMGASDMVIETDGKSAEKLYCDIRIDGRMRPLRRILGAQAVRSVIGSFKALSNLSTSGEFKPQETIYEVPVALDLDDPDAGTEMRKARVASFRQHHGGSAIVMRLPSRGRLKSLEELSFRTENLQMVKQLMTKADGLIMLAGPMGSGKSTTA
jgi:type II secretory ATPase GspE/PulE/Tfp pilus assembly ATPase PilB-like protein